MSINFVTQVIMQATLATIYLSDHANTMLEKIAGPVHSLIYIPPVEVNFPAVGNGAKGDGFEYNNTATSYCNTVDHPLYDPNYFDAECDQYYWCYRIYNSDCSPNYAYGYTEEEADWIAIIFYYSFVYTEWLWFGVRAIPWTTCLYLNQYRG